MWCCIYPTYINSKRSAAEGRRIPKSRAVENPTSQEILDILKNAGLPVRLEKKMYPRDQNRDMQFQGRVRVQLKDDEGAVLNPKFPSRTSLMLYAAEMIPKLKSRQQKSAVVGGQAPHNDPASQKAVSKKKKR